MINGPLCLPPVEAARVALVRAAQRVAAGQPRVRRRRVAAGGAPPLARRLLHRDAANLEARVAARDAVAVVVARVDEGAKARRVGALRFSAPTNASMYPFIVAICVLVQFSGLDAQARQPGTAEQLPLMEDSALGKPAIGAAVKMQPVCHMSRALFSTNVGILV